MKLKCCGCEAVADTGNERNVGKMQEKSGFVMLFLCDGGFDSICSACWGKLSHHLTELAKILGPNAEDNSLYSLLVKLRKKDEYDRS